MFLATAFSSLYFLVAPASVDPSIEIILQHHLETAEGRAIFLTDKLASYAIKADRLNHEIEVLAQTIKTLSPKTDQQQILNLTEEMNQKMNRLVAMMSVLNLTHSLNDDFLAIDSILKQTDPLSPLQHETVDRIVSLCKSVD